MITRKITKSQLKKILADHQLWFNTDGKKGVKADLSHADLKFTNFKHACLAEADFSCSNLQECDFTHADLTGADLRRAFLQSANLPGRYWWVLRVMASLAKRSWTGLRWNHLFGRAPELHSLSGTFSWEGIWLWQHPISFTSGA